MMRTALAIFLGVILSGCMAAEPKEDPLIALLAGHRMAYDNSENPNQPIAKREQQSWFADGTTIYHTWGFGHAKSGVWKVDHGKYCSSFPNAGAAPQWTCYRTTILDGGARLRFEELGRGWFKGDWTGQFIK